MKKLVLILLTVALCAFAALASAETMWIDTVRVNGNEGTLNIRSTPANSDNRNILIDLPHGTQVEAYEMADSVWRHITVTYKGTYYDGYVSNRFLNENNPNYVPDPYAQGTTMWVDTVRVNGREGTLNIRSTPANSDDRNILIDLPHGTQVTAYEMADSVWRHITVTYRGTYYDAYVSNRFLNDVRPYVSPTKAPAPVTAPPVTAPPMQGVTMWVDTFGTGSVLNVRSTPTTADSSNIVTTIAHGTQVTAYEIVNTQWRHIVCKGSNWSVSGYVQDYYLSPTDPNAYPVGETMWVDTVSQTGKVGTLNVRSTPANANDSNIIMAINHGTEVTAYEMADSVWRRISVNMNGHTIYGYVSNRFLQSYGQSQPQYNGGVIWDTSEPYTGICTIRTGELVASDYSMPGFRGFYQSWMDVEGLWVDTWGQTGQRSTVNLRSKPSKANDSNVLVSVPHGYQVDAYELYNNGWRHVKATINGRTYDGYMSNAWLVPWNSERAGY